MRIVIVGCGSAFLIACHSTYGPGELSDPTAEVQPVCREDDDRPGRESEQLACENPQNYLCDP